jgi:hypothetical protein
MTSSFLYTGFNNEKAHLTAGFKFEYPSYKHTGPTTFFKVTSNDDENDETRACIFS